MVQQPFMNFEIREKVQHFKDGQSFQRLSSLELEPIVKVYESDKKIEVTGYLILNGEFQGQSDDWDNQFEQSDGIHYSSFFNEEGQMDSFQYQIPVSFEIEPRKVSNVADVFVLVEHFDYEVLSDQEMELVANVRLAGVHPEPLQDQAVEEEEEEGFNAFSDSFSQEYTDDQGSVLNREEEQVEEVEVEEQEVPTFKAQENELEEEEVEQAEEKQETVEADSKLEAEEETEEAGTDEEAESVDGEVDEEAEAEEEIPSAGAKVRIGIQGKNRRASEDDDSKSPSNLIYSLLKKNKSNLGEQEAVQEEQQEEVKQVDAEVDDIQEANSDTEDYDKKTVVSIEDYKQDKGLEVYSEEVEETEDQEEYVQESESSSSAIASDTKDMLYSLLKGNEETKYRLKMYIVKKEDTVDQVAEKYNLTTAELMTHNKLEVDELEEGQILYLPTEY